MINSDNSGPLMDLIVGILYPLLGPILIMLGVGITIWLIIHVEYGERFSLSKVAYSIILLSIFYGFGIQIVLTIWGL